MLSGKKMSMSTKKIPIVSLTMMMVMFMATTKTIMIMTIFVMVVRLPAVPQPATTKPTTAHWFRNALSLPCQRCA